MMNSLLSGAIALFFSSVAVAQTPSSVRIDIKPGLWEVSRTSEQRGMPPIDFSKMTAEARARAELMMKQREAQGAVTRKFQECISEDQLRKQRLFDTNDESCERSIAGSTSSKFEVRVQCSARGNRPASRETVTVETSSREAYSGRTETTVGEDSDAMKMRSQFSGKWLSASCGDLKPGGSKRLTEN